jgi:hypothetical protein
VTSAVVSAATDAKGTQSDADFVPHAASPGGDEAAEAALMIECEIKSHLEAIALYERQSSGSDAQLRDFAQRILPQLRRHLALLLTLKRGIDLSNRDAPQDRRS